MASIQERGASIPALASQVQLVSSPIQIDTTAPAGHNTAPVAPSPTGEPRDKPTDFSAALSASVPVITRTAFACTPCASCTRIPCACQAQKHVHVRGGVELHCRIAAHGLRVVTWSGDLRVWLVRIWTQAQVGLPPPRCEGAPGQLRTTTGPARRPRASRPRALPTRPPPVPSSCGRAPDLVSSWVDLGAAWISV